MDGAIEVGCQIFVSTFTLAELENKLKESEKRYRRFQGHPLQAFSIVDDVILRTYAAERKKSPGQEWHTFYALHFPPSEALAEFKIESTELDEPVAILDPDRERVRDAVALIKGPEAHPSVVSCDTNNLILIQVRRKKLKADVMGRRVWLVTLDQALKTIEQHLVANEVFEVQSTKQVGEWAADLSFHLPPDDIDLGEYALHVLQSQLGLLAEDPIFADVNFLSILEESPFNIDALLSAKPARTRRVLVALQQRREIERLLADEPDEPAERDAWAELLGKIVKETLDRLDTAADKEEALAKMEAERDEAVSEKESAHRDLDDWTKRIEDLERRIDREAVARAEQELPVEEDDGGEEASLPLSGPLTRMRQWWARREP